MAVEQAFGVAVGIADGDGQGVMPGVGCVVIWWITLALIPGKGPGIGGNPSIRSMTGNRWRSSSTGKKETCDETYYVGFSSVTHIFQNAESDLSVLPERPSALLDVRICPFLGGRVESRSGAVELGSALTVSDPFGLSVSEYLTVSSVSRSRSSNRMCDFPIRF